MKKRTNSIINQQKQQQSIEVNRSKQNVNNVRSKKRTGDAISFEMESRQPSRIAKPGTITRLNKTCTSASVTMKPSVPKASTSTTAASNGNNENKPPLKLGLTRSATTVITKRPVVPVTKVAPKRPAVPTTSVVDSKRPKVTATRSAVTKPKPAAKAPTQNGELKLINRPKPEKWDLKGRLAYATEELMALKQRFTEISEENAVAKKALADFMKDKDSCKSQVDEMKDRIEKLAEERDELMKKVEVCREELKIAKEEREKLKQMREKDKSVIKELSDQCLEQERVCSEQTAKIENLTAIVAAQEKNIEEITAKRDALKVRSHELDRERRVLHNTIQDLKGNIRVFCRVRPRTEKEVESQRKTCTLNFVDNKSIEVGRSEDTQESCGKIRTTRQEFSFDKVFPPEASQEEVFEELEALVQSALEGYNVCVFAYGQTGSGKTYTMEGCRSKESEGMIPRTVRHIFKEMKNFQLLGWDYTVEASILEIYNEHIVDLLDSQTKTHEIRMVDNKKNDLYVTNLHIEPIDCPEKLYECLSIAQKNRAVAATSANERSSRSHSVTRIRLTGKHAARNETCIGNLNLVDLAGSERLRNEVASRTTETKNINKSLSNLGNVILALIRKQDHIPYRNSKLTHLLMPSLGGNSKTLMLLNISPLDDCYNETLNSLRFASTVNSCHTGGAKKQCQQTVQNL